MIVGNGSVDAVAQPITAHRYAGSSWGAYTGRAVTRSGAAALPAYYSGVRLLAITGGAMPLRVHDAQGKVVGGGDLALRLRVKPNAYTPAPAFWASVIAHVVTAGNAYLAKTAPTDGLSIPELHLLHPESVQPYRDERREIRFDVYASDGSAHAVGLTSSEILHVKGWTLGGDTIKGDSPVGVQRHALGNALAAQEYQGRTWKDGAVPRGVLSSDEALTREQIVQLRESWHEAYGGLSNSGKMAVLPRGTTYESVSLSMADAQFIEQMRYGVDDIARILNLPAAFLGGEGGGSLTYTNAQQNDIHLLKFPLRAGALMFVESALNMDEDLFGAKSAWVPRFDPDELIKPDISTRYRVHQMAILYDLKTPDEIRVEEGLEPLGSPASSMLRSDARAALMGEEAAAVLEAEDAAGVLEVEDEDGEPDPGELQDEDAEDQEDPDE